MSIDHHHPVLATGILSGLHLLEADAGTGKTWTLTGLIVRAVIERNDPIDSILALTFTNAAVAELKARSRTRLQQMLDALSDDADESVTLARSDPFIGRYAQMIEAGELIDQARAQSPDRAPLDVAQSRARLRQAIARSDELAAYTIHGFCRRLLAEQPMLARVPAPFEVGADQSTAIATPLRRWWQIELADLSVADLVLLDSIDIGLRRLRGAIELRLIDDDAALEPAAPDWREIMQHAAKHRHALAQALARDADALQIMVSTNGRKTSGISGKRLRPDWFSNWLPSLQAFAATGDLKPGLLAGAWPGEHLGRFTTEYLLDAGATDATMAQLSLPKVCSTLVAFYNYELNGLLAGMVAQALPYVRQQLTRTQIDRAMLGHDDLIRLTRDALQDGANGERLAQSLRARYRLALIDECQDTDPAQWAILRRIWPMSPDVDGDGNTGGDADADADVDVDVAVNSKVAVAAKIESGLILVGDPKQSIYAFRNADVYAYLDAREHWRDGVVPKRWRLSQNQRSSAPLLAAINALFKTRNSFVVPQIDYQPSSASDRVRPQLGDAGVSARAAFYWVTISSAIAAAAGTAPTTTTTSVADICQACAQEVKRLLQSGDTTIDGRALRASDIAVLVNRHDEGREIKLALRTVGLSAVEMTRAQVTQSSEALELHRLIAAIAEPMDSALLRGALATRLLGVLAAQLDQACVQYADLFAQARDRWYRQGPMAAVTTLLRRFNSQARLTGYEDAERALTNVTHLLELLTASREAGAGATQAERWLARLIADPGSDELEREEVELRLESDAQLIRILTVHKSKGLEFAVVFVPFAWRGRPRASAMNAKKPALRYHRAVPLRSAQSLTPLTLAPSGIAQSGWQSVIDLHLNRPMLTLDSVNTEENAQSLRLLYVAVTRAIHRCYLFGPVLAPMPWSGKGSALEWLLSRDDEAALTAMRTTMQQVSIEQLLTDPVAGGVAADPSASSLRLARFTRDIKRRWTRSSYSRMLQSALQHAGDDPLAPAEHDGSRDRDQDTLRPPPEAAFEVVSENEVADKPAPDETVIDDSRFRFPASSTSGACLHRVLELTDFSAGVRSEHVAATLVAFGLEKQLTQGTCSWLNRVLRTPVGPQGLTLSAISRRDRLTEVEFNLRADQVDDRAIAQRIALDEPLAVELATRPWSGYLGGFIDLVVRHHGRYFIVDWKSNWLGAELSDYGYAGMRAAVQQHAYALQYTLYSVAMHRHLRARLRDYRIERDFGGVLYLFIRGIGASGAAAADSKEIPGVWYRPCNPVLIQAVDQLLLGNPA